MNLTTDWDGELRKVIAQEQSKLQERKRVEAQRSNWDQAELQALKEASEELDRRYRERGLDQGPYAPRYYDRKGNPITMGQYTFLQDWRMWGYKRVASDMIVVNGHWYHVSTVWMGLDMSFSMDRDREPIIFETMVFGSINSGADLYCQRYSTEEQAIRGHKEALRDTIRAAKMLPRKPILIHKGRKP